MMSCTHDPQLRDAITKRLLAGGAGNRPFELSKEFNIPTRTLCDWRAKAGSTQYVPHTTLGSRVLVIPDMHHPFSHPDTLPFLLAVKDKFHLNQFVCLGDEIDAHAFSRYIPDPDGMTPGKELQAAIDALTPIYCAFPNMLVCESNHTVRPWKKAFDSGLPASFLPTVSKILNAPDGWVWKKRHTLDGVLYIHGDNGKSGQYAAVHYMKQAKQPVVIGHIHAFGSVFYEGPHFAMNAGCLIDVDAYAFKYAKGALLGVSLGCGIVLDGKEAHFIPMHTDTQGRWTGLL